MSTVIVGASVGGVRTAQALRREGYAEEVLVVGGEAHLPYDKPPLSKQLLFGSDDERAIALITPEEAEASGIELRLGSPAESLDLDSRHLVLADGSTVTFDTLVIATGASARHSPWQPESGLHELRTLDDCRGLRADLRRHGGPVVVIGGGFIGSEVASGIAAGQRRVVMIDPVSEPLTRAVGGPVSDILSLLHRRNGVQTRYGVGVNDVEGRAGSLVVTLSDQTRIRAATVVVGIGTTPNVGWLQSSGVPAAHHVGCDQSGRVDGQRDVFAVGDVASWGEATGPARPIEHWTSAVEQANIVAHNILCPDDLRRLVPDRYVWSDQHGWKIQMVGEPGTGASHEIVGDADSSPPRAAFLYYDEGGDMVGAVTVNWPRASFLCRRAYAAGGTRDELSRTLQSAYGAAAAPAG